LGFEICRKVEKLPEFGELLRLCRVAALAGYRDFCRGGEPGMRHQASGFGDVTV